MGRHKLPKTEELDFSYLLGLMRPLYLEDRYSWLPELFSIIGHERLITLCRYCGGETIKIPTVEELFSSINSLQAFYDVYIKHSKTIEEVDEGLIANVLRIRDIYDVRDNQESHTTTRTEVV